MTVQQFKAVYFKDGATYRGYIDGFVLDARASGRTLAEVKAKLRAAIPEALRRERQNKIRGKDSLEETISVEIKP
jgi:hypothetical protein